MNIHPQEEPNPEHSIGPDGKWRPLFRLPSGPAILVAAAFVGPGTVMTASTAGAEFRFLLLWAVLFSVVATIILQQMAARLGIISGEGLAESISSGFNNFTIRYGLIGLVLAAILLGNSAYQTGNILGASSGLEILSPRISAPIWSAVIAAIALGVVILGRADVLQSVLTLLVAVMGILFVLAAVFCRPSIGDLLNGFVPRVPRGSEWFVIGLIGTTVVPYNLFLHASAAANRWGSSKNKDASLRLSQLDTIVSVSVGGVITAAILITAAVTFEKTNQELKAIKDVAEQLKPTLGTWAEVAFAIGLFSAGLTSAITAPVAAAFATGGCFGWSPELSNPRLKAVAALVIAIGLIFGIALGSSPRQTIIIAQVANGLLLPFVAVFLLITVNRSQLMGQRKNTFFQNAIGIAIVLVTAVIAAQKFYSVLK